MATALNQTANQELFGRYESRIHVNTALSRALVSYQSNRQRPGYRWFKYKEGFSAALVEYFLDSLKIHSGKLLDPFAGTGAALFAGAESGLSTTGIELLPLGIQIMRARIAASRFDIKKLKESFARVIAGDWKIAADMSMEFPHLRITNGAFNQKTEKCISSFRTYLRDKVKNDDIRDILNMIILSILESISFTRKDGQYLRWDSRAPRKLPGKNFDKGVILTFEDALVRRLNEVVDDLSDKDLLGAKPWSESDISIKQGSCHHVLPELDSRSITSIMTSPPYCNRYDYTRTYALELAYLGVDESKLKELRQELLSCTVENRSKRIELENQYLSGRRISQYRAAVQAFESQDALQENITYLKDKAHKGELNNVNVARMVENYFFESAVTIFEWARIVKSKGYVIMVNDNVQYGGREMPVDLILSDFAEMAGFTTKVIWTLPRGKGNSSQQMGEHGRRELRKCVYVWQKN